MTEQFIPPHGGYNDLLTFQKAEIVYDASVKFCADILDRRDRTVDQMIQAARSGKQNIVEGSMASGTSKEAEINCLIMCGVLTAGGVMEAAELRLTSTPGVPGFSFLSWDTEGNVHCRSTRAWRPQRFCRRAGRRPTGSPCRRC